MTRASTPNTSAGQDGTAPQSAASGAPRRGLARRSRVTIAMAVIISLLANGLLQHMARVRQRALIHPIGATANISSLNSFSLGLLLGGLRGPLVMMLWMSSENQKQQRDLEDFDTKLELIRLLQPEFDSVTIFQIWNKAYNASVMMSSLSNKYTTILDAIDYADKMARQRPNNLNIIMSLADVYAQKLGNSQEKEYFSRRMRAESFAPIRLTFPIARIDEYEDAVQRGGAQDAALRLQRDEAAGKASVILDETAYHKIEPLFHGPGVEYVNNPDLQRPRTTGKPYRMKPLLDLHGNLLPAEITPNPDFTRPPNVPPGGQWNDGAPMQYLAKYQPFPYGLSPLAVGYNFYKQAQVLRDTSHQRHLQISDLVVDGEPAIGLKMWSESEVGSALRNEWRAWSGSIADERQTYGPKGASALRTADMSYKTVFIEPAAADEAIYEYGLACRLVDDAMVEYDRHLKNFARDYATFRSHKDSLRAMQQLAGADEAYLKLAKISRPGATASNGECDALKADAAEHYHKAIFQYEELILNYYIGDEMAPAILPKGLTRLTVGDSAHPVTAEQLDQYMANLHKLIATMTQRNIYDTQSEDRLEFERYIERAHVRLGLLGK